MSCISELVYAKLLENLLTPAGSPPRPPYTIVILEIITNHIFYEIIISILDKRKIIATMAYSKYLFLNRLVGGGSEDFYFPSNAKVKFCL